MIEWVIIFRRTQLTIRGQHIPTLELDMDKECQAVRISNLSTVKPTTFYFDISFTQPMSRWLCKFWHHNNGTPVFLQFCGILTWKMSAAYCSQRILAIALDESNDASNVASVVKTLEGNFWYEINTINSSVINTAEAGHSMMFSREANVDDVLKWVKEVFPPG